MTEAELNERRYTYFKMIIESRITGDAGPLFPYIADECIWGGTVGKEAVIESLKHIDPNYRHESVLVRLGTRPDPLRGTDENGHRVGFSLWYEPGEVCMYDVTVHNRLLFRLKLDEDGKIREFYGTLPAFFSFYPIP